MTDSRRAISTYEFNDPETWGYCGMCAWICTVDLSVGLLVEHRRVRNGHEDSLCSGSRKIPIDEVPNTASARKQVSLRKVGNQSARRAHWQRQRQNARYKEGRMRAGLSPVTVEITNTETGVTTDISEFVVGPIVLHIGGDDGEDHDD